VRIEGCRCLVVGGARRLGREVALSLATQGAAVAVSSRSAAAAENTCGELQALGHRTVAASGDVGTHLDARHLVSRAAAGLGGLDAVVFTASGPFSPKRPELVEEAEWDASMDVLARGLLFVAQAAYEQFMLPGGGEESASASRRRPGAAEPGPTAERGIIVVITDVAAVQPWAPFVAHCAAKAAQLMVQRVLAKAWAADGVRVCGVAPGPVDLADDERREASVKAARRAPSGRLVAAADVTAAVRLCITSAGMTGTTVTVDGGALLG